MSGVPPAILAVQNAAADRLFERFPQLVELGEVFERAGHELAVVGGVVRDSLLERPISADVDFATSARPEAVQALLEQWAPVIWDAGIRFGTVAARRDDVTWEMTTYRSDSYQHHSRKPEVEFGHDLSSDLFRRDFTVNAMAIKLPTREFFDPANGLIDLSAGRLRTPISPERSFSDDPLRMMRAARFVSELGLQLDEQTLIAMTNMAERLSIVSVERVQTELVRLMLGRYPRLGLHVMTATELAEQVLPEVPAMQLEIDEHHRHKDVYEHSLTVLDQAIELEGDDGPDLVLRLAALLHDIGKPRTRRLEPGGGVSFHHHEVVGARMTRKRLRALKFPKEIIEDVSRLVELHLRFHGYGTGAWTDAAVRRYVRDAGPLLQRLHRLTRADCTTRNQRRARALQRAYDDLEDRIDKLQQQEELEAIRPDLDGNEIMSVMGWSPGPHVGQAYRYLLDLRLDAGPMPREEAVAALRSWAAEQSDLPG